MLGGKRKGGAWAVTDVLEKARTDLDVTADRQPATARPALPGLRPPGPPLPSIEPRRLFVLLPFAVILGEIVYVSLDAEPAPALVWGGAVTIALALWFARLTDRLRWALTLTLAFWGGFCLLAVHQLLLGEVTMLSRPAYGSFSAIVETVTPSAEGEQRVIVSAISPLDESRPVDILRARLLLKDGPTLAPGDRVSGGMRFYPVPGPVLPGSHDTQFHSYFDGIAAFGNLSREVTVTPPDAPDLNRRVEQMRGAIGQRIDARIAGEANGVARSMMIGDQSRITDDVREAMAASGLAHIYSISGLHLSLVAIGVLSLMRSVLVLVPGLSARVSVKKLAAVVALAAAFFYLLLAGGAANVPAFRSTLMIGLVLGAVLAGRRALTMRNVAIAALAILAIDPASVFRPSFQLSFAAVVALVGAYEWGRGAGEVERGFWARLRGIVVGTAVTSLVAGLATLLFSAYHFQQTAPLGLLANLMALILVMPIMTAIVLATLLMPLGWEGPFLSALGILLEALIGIARLVAGWGEGLSLHPLLTPAALLLGLLALAWFAVLKSWHRLIGPALLVPAVLFFCLDHRPDLLIADTTQAIAVRTEQGLELLDGKETSFAVTVWSETFGEPIAPADGAHCDAVGCFVTGLDGFRLALVREAAGFYEDCGLAEVVVSRRPAPATCSAPLVIDAARLAAGGVHWLAWQGDHFEVRAARTGLSRPWRAAPP